MSKETKTGSATEEPVIMHVSGVPVEELELGSIGLATEFITDLKKQLEEAKEEAKDWEENWNVCREQVKVLSRQSDIISMALKLDDIKLLDLAFGFVRGCYNQQIKKEQEAENNGKV